MRFLEEETLPQFDLCYIDGAHSWLVDGFAFLLVDKLMKVGGWIVFDDFHWTYALSPSERDTNAVKSMPIDERETPQVQKIYDLLVKTHPCYDNFSVKDGLAYARKVSSSIIPKSLIRRETVYIRTSVLSSIREIIWRIKRADQVRQTGLAIRKAEPRPPVEAEPEAARDVAIGQVTGSLVDRVEKAGWEFVYTNEVDVEEALVGQDELVGLITGSKADRLRGKKITIRKKGKPAADFMVEEREKREA
jgi:hypothetical protein